MVEKRGDDVKHIRVKVENLEFSYRIRHAATKSLKQSFINSIKRLDSDVHINAIYGINFDLFQGEVLGIVGRNGAGKSTLLKILAGVLPPSSGSLHTSGRIAPLIELGAGFNLELTGAENIVLFGVMLGNSRKEMSRKVDEIAEWAGLTTQINLPARTYSTGMLSRLGFAVVTFQPCEMLIIDEVLSVGDADFQKKSLNRIKELIAGGTSAILVSHDAVTIKEHCSRVMWLDQGRQVMIGPPSQVMNAYQPT